MKYKRSNKHYTNCLTSVKRTADKLDKKSDINLGQMVEAYRVAVG